MFLRALRVVQAREGGEEQGGDGAGARGLEAAGGGAARGVHRGGARRAGDGDTESGARAHGEYFELERGYVRGGGGLPRG